MTRQRHFLVYMTTCKVTGRYYIGCHKTFDVDDGYLGSGLWIKRAVAKYGKDRFKRRILRRCTSAKEMYAYEKKIIAKHLGRKMCMNIAHGGLGGWNHANTDPEIIKKRSQKFSQTYRHTDERKAKIGAANSKYQTGEGNSHYGKSWIANDQFKVTTRVYREQVACYLEQGWRPGRVMRYEHVNLEIWRPAEVTAPQF